MPSTCRLLLGKEEDKEKKATRANFLKSIKWVSQTAGPKDLVLFAFIGQGGPLGESGDRRCYFLADSTFKGRDKDAVTTDEIEDAFKKFKNKHVAVFLDIDFKGFVDDGKSRAIAEPTLGKAPYKEFLGDDGSEDHLPVPGRVAFLATNGLSTSLDLKNHEPVPHHGQRSSKAWRGKADNEGFTRPTASSPSMSWRAT